MEEKLQSRIMLYKDREKRHRKETEEYKIRIRNLQNAIRELTKDVNLDHSNGDEEEDVSSVQNEENEEMDLDEEEQECEDEVDLPQSVYDNLYRVFRCSECGWEVVEGQCQSPDCALEHAYVEENEDRVCGGSVFIDVDGSSPDRQLSPRGTTPIRDVPEWVKSRVPLEYRDFLGTANDEYVSLISRGATRGMCIRYNLEFTNETGIVAWADTGLYDMYAGPEMREGDFWKIYLGRRLELDEEDTDGSEFVHDLLEDVLLFPSKSLGKDTWETVEERPGIWATRPFVGNAKQDPAIESDGEESDVQSVNSWSARYAEQENIGGRRNDGPVRRVEDYDTTDDNASDVCEQEPPPAELAILANVPDTGYDSATADSESEAGSSPKGQHTPNGMLRSWLTHEVQDTGEQAEEETIRTPPTVTGDELSSADEDFDSQEELSGDAETLRVGREWLKRRF